MCGATEIALNPYCVSGRRWATNSMTDLTFSFLNGPFILSRGNSKEKESPMHIRETPHSAQAELPYFQRFLGDSLESCLLEMFKLNVDKLTKAPTKVTHLDSLMSLGALNNKSFRLEVAISTDPQKLADLLQKMWVGHSPMMAHMAQDFTLEFCNQFLGRLKRQLTQGGLESEVAHVALAHTFSESLQDDESLLPSPAIYSFAVENCPFHVKFCLHPSAGFEPKKLETFRNKKETEDEVLDFL
jgi:hypothetical protein